MLNAHLSSVTFGPRWDPKEQPSLVYDGYGNPTQVVPGPNARHTPVQEIPHVLSFWRQPNGWDLGQIPIRMIRIPKASPSSGLEHCREASVQQILKRSRHPTNP